MRKFFYLLLLPVLLLSGSSCSEIMDPFEGSDGVRANINGYKCVMDGYHGNQYVTWPTGGSATLSINVRMVKLLDNQNFMLQLNVSDNTAVSTGIEYHFTPGGPCSAILSSPPGAAGVEVPMSGWIRFLQLDAGSHIVEAEFELSGTAPRSREEFDVRHGFLRLYK